MTTRTVRFRRTVKLGAPILAPLAALLFRGAVFGWVVLGSGCEAGLAPVEAHEYRDPPPLSSAGAILGTTIVRVPTEGGTISWPAIGDLPGGTLAIPRGALPRDVEITAVVREAGPEREAGAIVYELLPEGLAFAVPPTLTLGYRQEWIDTNGIDESEILVGYSSSTIGGDVGSLVPITRDPLTDTVTVEIPHFTWFGLICPAYDFHHLRARRLVHADATPVTAGELAADSTLNLVVVHGWGSRYEDFAAVGDSAPFGGRSFGDRLVEAFGTNPVRVAYYDYPSAEGIRGNAIELAALLRTATADGGNLVLIGHSMGGLVSRSAIEQSRAQVAALVTLGTPHKGTGSAALLRVAVAASGPIASAATACWSGRTGRGLSDLQRGSAFLSGVPDLVDGLNPFEAVRPPGGAPPYFLLWTEDDNGTAIDPIERSVGCSAPTSVVDDDSERGDDVLVPVYRAQVAFSDASSRRCAIAAHNWLYAPAADIQVSVNADGSGGGASWGEADQVVPERIAQWLCGCAARCCETGRACGVGGACVGHALTTAVDAGPRSMDAGRPPVDAGRDADSGPVDSGSVAAPPMAPSAMLPSDTATLAEGLVSFSWSPVSGAARYHLMVCSSAALDTGCVNPDSGGVGVEPGLGATVSNVSVTAGTWYWAVRAIRAGDVAGWGPYSAVRRLTVTPPPPLAPVLSAPTAGASVAEGATTFSWGAAVGAARYHLMVCTSPSLSSGCADTDGGGVGIEPPSGIQSASVPLSVATWYWAVRGIRAGDVGGWGAYSATRTLTVSAASPPAPAPISPADGVTLAPGSVTFAWSSAASAARYHFLVCSSADLSSGCLNPDGGAVGSEPAAGVTDVGVTLAAGTWYWAVRAIRAGDVGGWGPYCATRTLTVSCASACTETDVACTADNRPTHCVRDATTCLTWVPESAACPAGDVCKPGPAGPSTGCVPCGGTGDACCFGGVCSGGRTCQVGGLCGPAPCPTGQTLCSGSCADTATNLANCGGCGIDCPTPLRSNRTCVAGACGFACASPYGDCNASSSDGCETDLQANVSNCGSCGHACTAPANASPYCNFGLCASTCNGGYGDCDGNAANGCETSLNTSVTNCSACGAACSLPSAVPACIASSCAVVGCTSGFADCDGLSANGCERDIRSDSNNCGTCGHVCAATEGCSAGACITTCGAPRMMCGATCIDVTTNAANCGACGRVCGGTDTCAAGICSSQRVVEVGGGRNHSCARRANGAVVCWGHNGLGQLGNGAGTDSLAPVAVSGVTNATDLSVGAYTSCVVRATGTVSCWGDNSYGKVGDGTTALRLSPVAVSGLTGAAEVSAGPSHTCARTTAGQVYCWGDNSQGQLGDGTISVTPRLAPGLVPGIADATDLAVGDGFTCVRRSSGQVWCWGENTYGELGSGATSTPRATPGAVVGLTDGVAVVAGGYHACALRATGRVVCWGENGSGQLGAVTVPADRSATPVVAPLPALDAVELATGTAHTCARRSGGTVYCWGYNGNGQVGDGTLVSRTAPVVVPTGGVSAQVGLGDLHSCAALDTGALMCWGNNANGRLGDGTTVDRALPVAVLGL